MIKAISELLVLIRWLISTNKAERFREDVEEIKRDPSGKWSDRFGRVQSDTPDGVDRSRYNDNTDWMPSGNSKSPRR